MTEAEIPDALDQEHSPHWSTNTKLIVGITLVAVAAGLLVQFRPLLTPIAYAVILSYLLLPVVEWLAERTFFSWRGATNIVFLLLLLIALSSLTASGFALVNQFENLIVIIETFLTDLPTIIEEFLASDPIITISFLNYQLDLGEYIETLNIDLLAISEQLLSVVQPLLGQAGSILTRVATSALTTIGWGGFVFAVSYLALGEARQSRRFLKTELASISYDIGRMTREMIYIWNAFLRGQVVVFLLSSSTMFVLMSILGVRYALGLAILSGIARFIPYIGQYISGIVNALVAYFLAEGNYFGLEPFYYMLLVVVLAFLHDQSYDSLVIPKLIGGVLGVHPALVLIVALVAVQWIGVLGLLLAAPVLSSFQLILGYMVRKMMDQDPWPDPEVAPLTLREQIMEIIRPIRDRILSGIGLIKILFIKIAERMKRK
jgi:predicted PurR-regulated permease PerM